MFNKSLINLKILILLLPVIITSEPVTTDCRYNTKQKLQAGEGTVTCKLKVKQFAPTRAVRSLPSLVPKAPGTVVSSPDVSLTILRPFIDSTRR